MVYACVQADKAFWTVMYVKRITAGSCFIGYVTIPVGRVIGGESDVLPDFVMYICVACRYREVPEQDIGHCPDDPVIICLPVVSGFNPSCVIIDKVHRVPLLLFYGVADKRIQTRQWHP